jgi:hypothetical protein
MTEKEKGCSILANEIESWKKFEYALREEDMILFNKMLNECQKEEYSKAFNAKGEYHSSESLFMVLMFQQQKMINKIINRLSKYKQRSKKSNLGNP